MGLKKFKPTTPGTRFKINPTFDELTASKPEKSLTRGVGQTGGRTNSGRMSMRYIGGGHKKKFRFIDFKRNKFGVPGVVKSIEYDPNRSARIALVYYADGDKAYILAPNGLAVNQTLNAGKGVNPDVGNAMYLSEIPLGTTIHNIELKPGQGGKMARSAGSYAQLLARDNKFVTIKLPSGETRMILTSCMATIGSVSNSEHNLVRSGKAGRSRWLGRRPRVRGVAMNPIDHPMGGGEGRASGGHPRSRKGIPAKGYKTRKAKNASNRYIIDRRKK